MSTFLLSPRNEQARELAPEVSSVVVEEAIADRAPIALRSEDLHADGEYVGRIVSGDRTTINVELDSPADSSCDLFDSTNIVAVMIVANQRFLFSARCMRSVGDDDSNSLYLLRPEVVSTVQRRRSKRYRLQQPTMVTLFADTSVPHKGFPGAMLNLSPEGVACRIKVADAPEIKAGNTIRLRFLFGPSLDLFDLLANVINVTEASDPENAVLGLEFQFDESSTQSQDLLRSILEETTGLGSG